MSDTNEELYELASWLDEPESDIEVTSEQVARNEQAVAARAVLRERGEDV